MLERAAAVSGTCCAKKVLRAAGRAALRLGPGPGPYGNCVLFAKSVVDMSSAAFDLNIPNVYERLSTVFVFA